MRTTLTLDDDVLDAARELAEDRGQRLGEVVSALMRSALKPVDWHLVDGFPMFDVPVDGPMITAEAVARARDDE